VTEQQQNSNVSVQPIKLLADGLALVYHEARQVRFLIRSTEKRGHLYCHIAAELHECKVHKNRTDGEMFQPGPAMNAYCGGRSSRPARLFSLGLLDVPQGTPASSSLPRSHGGRRSQPPRYGIHG